MDCATISSDDEPETEAWLLPCPPTRHWPSHSRNDDDDQIGLAFSCARTWNFQEFLSRRAEVPQTLQQLATQHATWPSIQSLPTPQGPGRRDVTHLFMVDGVGLLLPAMRAHELVHGICSNRLHILVFEAPIRSCSVCRAPSDSIPIAFCSNCGKFNAMHHEECCSNRHRSRNPSSLGPTSQCTPPERTHG